MTGVRLSVSVDDCKLGEWDLMADQFVVENKFSFSGSFINYPFFILGGEVRVWYRHDLVGKVTF